MIQSRHLKDDQELLTLSCSKGQQQTRVEHSKKKKNNVLIQLMGILLVSALSVTIRQNQNILNPTPPQTTKRRGKSFLKEWRGALLGLLSIFYQLTIKLRGVSWYFQTQLFFTEENPKWFWRLTEICVSLQLSSLKNWT